MPEREEAWGDAWGCTLMVRGAVCGAVERTRVGGGEDAKGCPIEGS